MNIEVMIIMLFSLTEDVVNKRIFLQSYQNPRLLNHGIQYLVDHKSRLTQQTETFRTFIFF